MKLSSGSLESDSLTLVETGVNAALHTGSVFSARESDPRLQ